VLTHGRTMKRLFFPAPATFALVPAFVASAMLAGAACDPKLDIVTTPGDAGLEASPLTDAPATAPPAEAAPPEEAGPSEAGTEAGPGTGHVVDGVNDFAPGEKFATTSTAVDASYHAYAAWDAKNIYFGMEGNDVPANTANAVNKWVMMYIGRDAAAGSTTGLPYDTAGDVQQPTLPFPASIHLRWKVSGDYTNVQQWNAAMTKWEDAPLVPLTVFRQGSFVEMAVSRAALGSPTKIQLVMNMLIEGSASVHDDFTYAGVPSNAFTDMKDPHFLHYFEFDLTDLSKAPSSYLPK
jgi:hypothetical protein